MFVSTGDCSNYAIAVSYLNYYPKLNKLCFYISGLLYICTNSKLSVLFCLVSFNIGTFILVFLIFALNISSQNFYWANSKTNLSIFSLNFVTYQRLSSLTSFSISKGSY